MMQRCVLNNNAYMIIISDFPVAPMADRFASNLVTFVLSTTKKKKKEKRESPKQGIDRQKLMTTLKRRVMLRKIVQCVSDFRRGPFQPLLFFLFFESRFQ